MTLTFDMGLYLVVLVVAMGLLLSGKVRVDVAALFILCLLGVLNLIPHSVLFSGFSSDTVVALIAIMIIGAALDKTGLLYHLARKMSELQHNTETKVMGFLGVMAALVGALIQNFGSVVLLLPFLRWFSIRTGFSLSRLLMPAAYCAILGGTMTLMGSSPLLMLNDLIRASNVGHINQIPTFSLFEMTPVGILLFLSGLLYLLLIGRRLLPTPELKIHPKNRLAYYQETYGIGHEIWELVIGPNSSMVGLSLKAMEKLMPETMIIVGIAHNGNIVLPPLRSTMIQANMSLAVMADPLLLAESAKQHGCFMRPALNHFSEACHPLQAGLAEILIPPGSEHVGKAVNSLHLRRRYGIHVIAIHRGKKIKRHSETKKVTLKAGDTLVVYTRWRQLSALIGDPNFIVITAEFPQDAIHPERIPRALFALGGVILAVVWGGIPIALGLLIGALCMIGMRVINIDEAYKSISWKTVFLLAGLIPLGIAAQTTGTAAWFAHYLLTVMGDWPAWMIYAFFAFFCTVLSLLMTNVAATVVLVPIAIEVGLSGVVDPRLLALVVAISANNVFLLPSHQALALISAPGNYRYADFWRVGAGLSLIFLIVTIIAVPLLLSK